MNLEVSNQEQLDDNFSNAGGKYCKKNPNAFGCKVADTVKDAGKSIKTSTQDALQSIKAEGGKFGDKVKGAVDDLGGGKAMHLLNVANPAMLAIRGAVISMLQSNLLGIATNFGYMKDRKSPQWEKIKDKWYLMGGQKDKLNSNVDRGKGKKELFKDVVLKLVKGKKKNNFDGYSDAGGENIGTAVAISASLLGVATPILAAGTITAPAAVWTGTAAGFLGAVSPMMKQFAKENGATQESVDGIPPPTGDEVFPPPPKTDEKGNLLDEKGNIIVVDDTILGIPKTPFWIGIGVIALIGGFIVYKKIAKK